MSDFTVSIRTESWLAALHGSGDRLHANMVRVVTRLSLEVQTAVKEGKLSGQALHNRTGTLRRSINRVVQDDGRNVIAQVGTNVRYAAIHEYGFDGIVNVREHTRRSARQLAVGRKKQVGKSGGEITVRAHTMHMHMPERSFLRSTLRERVAKIRSEIKTAAREAIRP